MATTESNHKGGTGANHADNTSQSWGDSSSPHAADSDAKIDVVAVARFGRALPARIREAFKTNPVAVVAGFTGAGFVLGALLASKLGRVLATATMGYGVNRLLDGPVGREIGRYAKEMIRQGDVKG